jgi:hypothetical protein
VPRPGHRTRAALPRAARGPHRHHLTTAVSTHPIVGPVSDRRARTCESPGRRRAA